MNGPVSWGQVIGTGNDELVFEGTGFDSLADVLANAYQVTADPTDPTATNSVIIVIDEDTTLTLTDATLADINAATVDFA